MAVQFADGVIIGADSRTTTGSYIANRVTDKLTEVHDTIYCCRSGSAADTQAVADIVHYYLQMYSYVSVDSFKSTSDPYQISVSRERLIFEFVYEHSVQNGKPTVPLAATLFQEMCYQNKDNLSAGIIVGGWDKENGGSVWNIPLGGSLHRQPFAIGGTNQWRLERKRHCQGYENLVANSFYHGTLDSIGSGSTYIYGYCDATYRDGMSKDECIEFVKNCKTSRFQHSFERANQWNA